MFFESTNFNFCLLHPHQNKTYGYHGFQPKITPVWTYANQCSVCKELHDDITLLNWITKIIIIASWIVHWNESNFGKRDLSKCNFSPQHTCCCFEGNFQSHLNTSEPCASPNCQHKITLFQSHCILLWRGELFLWNRIWNLVWFCTGLQ